MAKQTTNITTAGSFQIDTVMKKHDSNNFMATLVSSGTFGGTSLGYQISFDGGTTKVPLKDQSGTVYAGTAADAINIALGNGAKNNDAPTLWATTTGGSGINIQINVFDNVG